jgi:hypothetical protein
MISVEEYRNNVRIEKESAHRSWYGKLGMSVILWFLSPRIILLNASTSLGSPLSEAHRRLEPRDVDFLVR